MRLFAGRGRPAGVDLPRAQGHLFAAAAAKDRRVPGHREWSRRCPAPGQPGGWCGRQRKGRVWDGGPRLGLGGRLPNAI